MGCPDETTLSDFLVGLLPEARRQEVLAHVEGCTSCQLALAAGRDSTPSAGVPNVPASGGIESLARGSTLSRYVVLERLGAGAMGVVYAAYDPELDRQVALKLLRPDGRHVEELRLRLLREAQALARLSHPHVVAVHDVGVCGDGIFLALELVDGTTLAEWLKEPRPWREVLRVFLDAGQGLAAAHAAGLVHRDFKPANVLVGRDGRARVTDFGLARPVSRGGSPPEAPSTLSPSQAEDSLGLLTRTGALLGTPAYMAPEQLEGRGADALSDQFSFCVALYEALHGVRPFEGVSLESLGRAAKEGRVRAPGRDTKVPSRVRNAVLRGLRPRPEDRFPSMEALLEALALRPSRVRTWVSVSAATACLVGVAMGYVVAHRREVRCSQEVQKLDAAWGPERRDRVRAAFLSTNKPYATDAWEKLSTALDAHASLWRSLRTEACLSAGESTSSPAWQTSACLDARLWQFAAVTEVLEKADAQTVQNVPQLVASLEGLAGCRDSPATYTRPQPPEVLRPRVDAARRRLAEARARMEAGRHAEGIEMTSALLQEIDALDYRPLDAEVLVLHGQLHGHAGKAKEAEDILYRALWAAEAGRDDETVARVWVLLVWIVGDQMARVGEADRLAQHARAVVERLGRERFPAIATDLHLRMGGVRLVQGKLDQADEELTQGLELSRKTYGPESLRTSYFFSSLGRVRSRQERPTEALALYRQAQELRESLWGSEHPALALSLSNIATQLLSLGRREEAVATWRRALLLLETSRSPDHASLAPPLNNLGVALREQGRLDEARQYLQRALAIFERSKGPDHPNTATALCALGMVSYDSQRLDEALGYHQQALERIQRTLGPDSPRAAAPLMYIGIVQHRMGHLDEARRHLQRAVQLWEKENGPDSATVNNGLRPLARLELTAGAPRKALAYCQRALKSDEQAQGAETPDIAFDLACIAEAHLALGDPTRAVPLLERARKVHARAPRDPLDEAWASFMLARALGEQEPAVELSRAVVLAEEARVQLTGLGTRARLELREVTDWQERHPAPSSVARKVETP
ncbi:serine/threonine-protein kinase [Archangium lansingense]|uniref:Tetratricopeptide repeat protein n=1 Tax=Archangium lansingense TaxID=2995310 RepID=A0ABT4ADN9_9BACT|nr:serine/threonine-protein kinase [Archangium lansinium]MCY1079793.1 tetratricopeptide repeat protein [Archangium lansinium]